MNIIKKKENNMIKRDENKKKNFWENMVLNAEEGIQQCIKNE